MAYTYDADNQLTRVNGAGAGANVTYIYDWQHRLAEKRVGTQATRYIYWGWQVVAEATGTVGGPLTITRRYVFDPTRVDQILAQQQVSGSTVLTTHYLVKDGLGSTTAVANRSTNAIVQRYAYDEFGAPTVLNSAGVPVGGAPITNYLFTGREYQPESGLYNYRHRFYHPTFGRFLQPDPIGEAGGVNLYGYVGNHPIAWGDPYGLEAFGFSSWSEYWNDVVDFWIGEAKGMTTVVTFGYIQFCYANGMQRSGGTFGSGLATAGELASGYGALKSGGRFFIRRAARKGPNGACFLAGTLVSTENGQQAIENIKKGDRVWSYNHETREWELREVVEALVHNYEGYIHSIEFEGEQIQATSNHPIWVEAGENLDSRPAPEDIPNEARGGLNDGRWVSANELAVGDHLMTRNGCAASIVRISSRWEKVQVYNLTVEALHNYAAGPSEILVHNKANVRILQSGGNKLTQATVDALNEAFGTNLDRDQMRRAIEALKHENRIPSNHHGPIDALGNYHKKGGGIIDNIGNFIP